MVVQQTNCKSQLNIMIIIMDIFKVPALQLRALNSKNTKECTIYISVKVVISLTYIMYTATQLENIVQT